MSEQCEDGGPVINTAVHLWPKTQSPDAEYLAVWGVGDDAIGIEVGGHVVSKTIRAWFELQADLLKKEEEIARLKTANSTEYVRGRDDQMRAADTINLSHIASLKEQVAALKSWQELARKLAEALQMEIDSDKELGYPYFTNTEEILKEFNERTAPPTEGAHVVFRYRGKAYNRPDSRGLCLGENMDDLCEKIPEGYFDVDIVVRADQTEGKQ